MNELENKLIAKFMGAKKTGSATGLKEGGVAIEYSAKISDNITAVYYDKPGAWTDFKEMKFHESWDWLMPVVQKIMKFPLNEFKITQNSTFLYWSENIKIMSGKISGDDEGTCGKMIYKYIETKPGIDATYKTVIEFIKWHNKTK